MPFSLTKGCFNERRVWTKSKVYYGTDAVCATKEYLTSKSISNTIFRNFHFKSDDEMSS